MADLLHMQDATFRAEMISCLLNASYDGAQSPFLPSSRADDQQGEGARDLYVLDDDALTSVEDEVAYLQMLANAPPPAAEFLEEAAMLIGSASPARFHVAEHDRPFITDDLGHSRKPSPVPAIMSPPPRDFSDFETKPEEDEERRSIPSSASSSCDVDAVDADDPMARTPSSETVNALNVDELSVAEDQARVFAAAAIAEVGKISSVYPNLNTNASTGMYSTDHNAEETLEGTQDDFTLPLPSATPEHSPPPPSNAAAATSDTIVATVNGVPSLGDRVTAVLQLTSCLCPHVPIAQESAIVASALQAHWASQFGGSVELVAEALHAAYQEKLLIRVCLDPDHSRVISSPQQSCPLDFCAVLAPPQTVLAQLCTVLDKRTWPETTACDMLLMSGLAQSRETAFATLLTAHNVGLVARFKQAGDGTSSPTLVRMNAWLPPPLGAILQSRWMVWNAATNRTVFVYWDLENMPFGRLEHQQAVGLARSIRRLFVKLGAARVDSDVAIEVFLARALSDQRQPLLSGLRDAGVKVVSANQRNQGADEALTVAARQELRRSLPIQSTTFAVISGDKGFSSLTSECRKKGYNVVWIHNAKQPAHRSAIEWFVGRDASVDAARVLSVSPPTGKKQTTPPAKGNHSAVGGKRTPTPKTTPKASKAKGQRN